MTPMLKPHLLWTILVFAVLGGLIARFAAQQNWSWPNSSAPSTSTIGNTEPNGYGNGNSANSYRNDGQRNVAGQFDYYALVLSWSPTYCAEKGDNDRMQCNRSDGRRYSFVLHGLWPQYERGYPSECQLPRRPFVPQPVIDNMLDIMPSRGLVIHEYRAHGTCSGLDPEQYFSTARRLFDGIKIPERFRNPFQSQTISPSDVRNEFLRVNPAFRDNMLAIVCGRRDRQLKEVRFCLSKGGKPRACGDNENQRKLCSADQVSVPPARSTVRDDASRGATRSFGPDQNSPLPGPRMNEDYRAH
jgi:ribonuclease T2